MKKLNWTITVDRFPELGIPEEEATEEELEAYERDLDKRIKPIRQIVRQLESVHLIRRRAIRRDRRMPKAALFRLRLSKDLYFTGYNFKRGGGKLVVSSGIHLFRTHALACSLFAFLKARGQARRFRHPKFSVSDRKELDKYDVLWRIENHDERVSHLYGPEWPPRFVSLLQTDLYELKDHINITSEICPTLVKLGEYLEVSPLSLESGSGIQIYYHRTRAKSTHITDPAAEVLPLVLYSYWSGESRKPKCSLSFSTVEPFALP